MGDAVFISIIIATRNREAILWHTLEMAVVAAASRQVEIIVVDDGDSTLNPPGHLVNKFQLYKTTGRGVSVARNFGVTKSKGKVLFFVDDDMWINAAAVDWIHKSFHGAQDDSRVYNLNWEYPVSLQEKLQRSKIGRYLLVANYHTMWGRMHKPGTKPVAGLYPYEFVGSGSLVMHRAIFDKIGGYNEAMIFQGEDIDLSNKLRNANIPIFTVFDVILFHNHQDRLELKSYLQRESNGYKSEFNAVRNGLLKSPGHNYPVGVKKWMYEVFAATEGVWLALIKFLPNHASFNFLSNKLIGGLAGLQRYKHWRKS